MKKDKELRCNNCQRLIGKCTPDGEVEILKPKGKIILGINGNNKVQCLCGKTADIKV
ncbi:hypothetical protein [Cetobacterium sp.]|uniref:hypothetical protein n=1 Tax=Cetobacterium sp. TaxID=2071632 RepID=UPI003EE747C1